MRIRAFDPADARACADLLTPAGAGEAVTSAEFARVTEAEQILVAERAAVLVGFLSFYRPDRFIHHLYVAPSCWRQGVGRALTAAALRAIGPNACLKCRSGNTGARGFYRRLGWIELTGGADEMGSWLWLVRPE